MTRFCHSWVRLFGVCVLLKGKTHSGTKLGAFAPRLTPNSSAMKYRNRYYKAKHSFLGVFAVSAFMASTVWGAEMIARKIQSVNQFRTKQIREQL